MISYASVPLSPPVTRVVNWVEANLSLADVFLWQRQVWPGKRMTHLTWPGLVPDRPILLGRLFWPRDASRWAYVHLLVSDNQLDTIRTANTPYKARPLVLSWDDAQADTTVTSLTTDMWALPAMPLSQASGHNGLNLLTLVDARWYWWLASEGVLTVTEGTTLWTDLYTALATALGITISVDPIPSAYLNPSGSLASNYEYIPPVLDAIAYNVGQRIVVGLDGKVRARSLSNGYSDVRANLIGPDARSPLAGGAYSTDGRLARPSDENAALPANVLVTFPQLSGPGGTPISTPYTVTVSTSSLGLSEFPGLKGTGMKVFHDLATYDTTNAAELLALTQQVAADHCRALGDVRGDWKWNGLVPWAPDPISDAVEWAVSGVDGPLTSGEVSTRVYPGTVNDLRLELLHAGSVGSLSQCCGGIVVNNSTQNDYFTYISNFVNTVNVFNTITVYGPFILNVTDVTLTSGNTYTDYNFNGTPKFAVLTSAAGSVTISGLLAPPTQGALLFLYNRGSGKVVLLDEDAGSAALNRIRTPLRVPYTVQPGREIILEYVDTRWRFAHPTLGVGPLGGPPITYGCDFLQAGFGLTTTDGGDGSNVLAVDPAILPANKTDWTDFHVVNQFTWYAAGVVDQEGSGAAVTMNPLKMYAVPFKSNRGGSINQLGLNVQTAGPPGNSALIGVYDNVSVSDPFPRNLLTAVPVGVGLNLVGPQSGALMVALNLTQGQLYWLVVIGNNPGGGLFGAIATLSPQQTDPILGYAGNFSTAQTGYTNVNTVFALPPTFPGPFSTFLTGVETPALWMFFNT